MGVPIPRGTPHLGQLAEDSQALRGVELSQAGGPGPHGTDVQAQSVLVGRRGEGEGVVLGGAQGHAGDAHPLPGLVVKVLRPLEPQVGDAWRGDRDLVTSVIKVEMLSGGKAQGKTER